MMLKGKGGIQYSLASSPLATGGEGEIYAVNGQSGIVAKIYLPGKAGIDKERKLVKMVGEPPDKSILSQIAWPQDVIYNAGQFVGFIMPKLSINEDLNVVYEYGSAAKYANMPWENRIIIAENLCAVLDSIHSVGHVVGDFNPKNISVNPQTGTITFLDTDSYHIQDGAETYRCDVGMPEYLSSEIQIKMRGGGTLATAALPTFTKDTDNFALAIHIFQLLMNGVHPFACAIIPSQSSVTAPQPSENIAKGQFPFMQDIPGVKIPVFAPDITILPKQIQSLFERAFVNGSKNPSVRPNAIEWHTALRSLRGELKSCGSVSHHQYHKPLSSCPWCEVNNRFAQKFKPKSTLTQTVITAPTYTPPPSASKVTPPTTSYTSTPKSSGNQTSSSSSMKKFLGIAAVLIIGVIIFATTRPNNDNFPVGSGFDSGLATNTPSPVQPAAPQPVTPTPAPAAPPPVTTPAPATSPPMTTSAPAMPPPIDHETVFGDLVDLWIVNNSVGNVWGDSGIRWDFRRDGTWVRINENNQGTRVYGTWVLDNSDNLTLRAENFGWENNTRVHTVRGDDANRVYVTVSGNINPDLVLVR